MYKKNINIMKSIKQKINNFIFFILQITATNVTKFNAFLFKRMKHLDWHKDNNTEFMDHDQDYFYQAPFKGNWFFFDRGVIPRLESNILFDTEEFKNLKLKKKLNILDLCSGDSYYSQFFFFDVAELIVSIDIDQKALDRGKKRRNKYKYLQDNHYFIKADVEKESIKEIIDQNLKKDISFDVVLFNGAIEHFNENQIDFILSSVLKSMKNKALFFCYTIIEKDEPGEHFHHHEFFFKSKEHLENIIQKYFKSTRTYENLVNDRHNIYCLGVKKD